MPSSLTPGSSHIACVQLRDADAAFAEIRAARHSQDSRNPFHAGPGFRGFTGSPTATACQVARPPWTDRTKFPWSTGDFYIQASDGSVALPAAGYDYNSHWTPLLAGLSPAGMAASLAAPDLHSSTARKKVVYRGPFVRVRRTGFIGHTLAVVARRRSVRRRQPPRKMRAQCRARVSTSSASGARRCPSMTARCGSIIIIPRSMPVAADRSSMAIKPRSHCRLTQPCMASLVRRMASS